MRLSAALISCVAPFSCLSAQALVAPSGTAAIEGNSSTAYPFGRGAGEIHAQYCYDATHFTGQGVASPILVTRLRWRANSSTVATAGGSYANVTVEMSTAAVDQAALTATFAANHGADRTVVHSGAVALQPTPSVATTSPATPNAWFVDLPIAPFLYDPTNGDDLLLDVAFSAGSWSGGAVPAHDCQTTAALVSRLYNTTSVAAPTGTLQANVGLIVEFGYAPAQGLFPSFRASAVRGATPLQVTFTDQSSSSDAGGVTSWAWDFDGDGVVDSTSPNPTFTYTGCGDFDVSLTVGDASHPAATLVRPGFVATDEMTAGFALTLLASPDIFQFTDTSTPPATSWAWDFDGDGLVDSTLQDPVVVLPPCRSSTVEFTATRNCRSDTVRRSVFTAANSLMTLFQGGNGLGAGSGTFFDLAVLNPSGLNVCGLDVNTTSAAGTPFGLDVWITPGTWVGVDTDPAAWRLVATASGTAAGGNVPSSAPLATPLHLAPGSYGVAIYYDGIQNTYTNGPLGPYGNADLQLTAGASRSLLFGGSVNAQRVWNGAIHYDTCQTGGSAGFGFFARGCAGSMPAATQTPLALPVLGAQFRVEVDNLPLSAALMLVGASRTASAFGPLPLDLGSFGAPGCAAHVSADARAFLFGAGNRATFAVQLPSLSSLLCLPFYTQALVLDPGHNALGAVASDAAAVLVGN